MLKEIQQLLKLTQLYSGAIDGQIGLETLRAIQKMPLAVTKTLQTLLKTNGYYQGNIDGIFGPQCYKALNSLIPAPVLTAKALQKIYPGASTKFIADINSLASEWGITTKAQFCLFLANVLVESGGFNDKDLRENFNYKPERLQKTFSKYIGSVDQARALLAKGPEAVANHVYGGRMGNGALNGDGWRYRGGGLIQTTGRYNFSVTGKGINEDLVNFPNRIAEPKIAVKSAMFYWKSRNCGNHADRMEVTLCRKAINGGINGLNEVNEYFLKAWAFLF
jgi:putative chitinase